MPVPPIPAQGWIRLISRPGNSANAFIRYENAVELSVFVDGFARMANWGETILPVAAGQHLVEARVRAFAAFGGTPASAVVTSQFGTGGIPVTVPPGQTVTVFYAAPNGPGTPGTFSYTPPPPAPTNGWKVAQIVLLILAIGFLPLILGSVFLILVAM